MSGSSAVSKLPTMLREDRYYIRAENIDVIKAYKQKMVEQGLKVDILSANQSQGMINGRIQIGQT